jgi:hypothetical protein
MRSGCDIITTAPHYTGWPCRDDLAAVPSPNSRHGPPTAARVPQPKPMRLLAHLVLLVLAVLIPVVALTAVTVVWVVRLERDAAQRATRETARSIAGRVDRELARAITALEVLATSTHLDTPDLHAFRQAAGAASSSTAGGSISPTAPASR